MTEPNWLGATAIKAIHEELIREHGGFSGVRDDNLLESALARPQNQSAHGEPNLVELAAAYAFRIARNRPFVDGNKRAALMAAYIFLGLNGVELSAPETEAVIAIQSLAAGELTEARLARWLDRHSRKP